MIVANDAARERRRRRCDDRARRRRRAVESSSGITTTAAALLLLLLLSAGACVPAVRAFSAPSNPPPSSSSPSSRRRLRHPCPPPFSDPRSPEEAIQNQLHHYQLGELDVAYDSYCSPGNKASVGSFEEFERQVAMPPYDLIVGHERADVLLELVDVSHGFGMYGVMEARDEDEDEEEGEEDDDDHDEKEEDEEGDDARILNVACCLVCIRPNRKARSRHPVWFWWEMSLVEETLTTAPIAATATSADLVGDSDGDDLLMYDDFDGGTTKIAVALLPLPSAEAVSSAVATATSTTPGGVIDGGEGDNVDGDDDALRGGRRRARWLVDSISPDFEDLDFEAESLSIEDFMEDDDDGDNEDDDEGGDYDDITILLDF